MGGKGSGRRPKPAEQKRRLGNVGGRKLPSHAEIIALPSLASQIPEPHRALGEHGRALWDRIWSSGAAWLRPALDGDIVLMACEMTDERSVLRRIVHAVGFEAGLVAMLVPLFAWVLGVDLLTALMLNAAMIVFFLVYAFLFNLAFDRVFGLPLSAQGR